MEVLDHLGKMGDLDYLDKVEAWDHLGIMEGLVYLGKTRHLDHLGKVEAVNMGQDLVDQDSIKMEDPAIREHFMEEIVHMGDLAHSQQEQDQANMDLKEEAAI